MRTTQRDKRTIWFALYQVITDSTDADGNLTGEHPASYGEITKARMNVSGGRGQAEVEMFGVDNPFTRTAVTDDLTTPCDTDTIWWFDVDPLTEPHNYRCTGIADTINGRTIALEELDVTHEDNAPIVSG